MLVIAKNIDGNLACLINIKRSASAHDATWLHLGMGMLWVERGRQSCRVVQKLARQRICYSSAQQGTCKIRAQRI